MKTKIEWWIFKDLPRDSDFWDGPFKSRKKACRIFNRDYRVSTKRQDFVVVKLVLEPQPTPRAAR
jgi:hypothetical protein